jgi:hypothetical protein
VRRACARGAAQDGANHDQERGGNEGRLALCDCCVDGRALARASGCARARRYASCEQRTRRRGWPEGASELQSLWNRHAAGRPTGASTSGSAIQRGTRHDVHVSDSAPKSPDRNRGTPARNRSEGRASGRSGQSARAAAAGRHRASVAADGRIAAERRGRCRPCCLRCGHSASGPGSPARRLAAAVAYCGPRPRHWRRIPVLAQPSAARTCGWAGAGSVQITRAGAGTCRAACAPASAASATAPIATAATGSGAHSTCTRRDSFHQPARVDRCRNAAAALHRD